MELRFCDGGYRLVQLLPDKFRAPHTQSHHKCCPSVVYRAVCGCKCRDSHSAKRPEQRKKRETPQEHENQKNCQTGGMGATSCMLTKKTGRVRTESRVEREPRYVDLWRTCVGLPSSFPESSPCTAAQPYTRATSTNNTDGRQGGSQP